MTKYKELSEPNSCFNKAEDTELIFVLLGRDVATPYTIRAWISERIRLRKNNFGDPQITEAFEFIDKLEASGRGNPKAD